MELLYHDDRVVVCVKPCGALSTDEAGGVPNLVRQALDEPDAVVRTVHRLDRAVGGLMVLARTARAAAELSEQIRQGSFEKEYLAVVHGTPPGGGTLEDLLWRDKARRMTFAVQELTEGAKPAMLHYQVLTHAHGMSLVRVRLVTGRTHQIRAQFASRGWPLVGDRKYGNDKTDQPIALWSCHLAFEHPRTGERLCFDRTPPSVYPWTELLGGNYG